jgi:2-polyprenyl-3-methyl-5-hydroxy-6-metoxy-1,4-benzoquinol methylase
MSLVKQGLHPDPLEERPDDSVWSPRWRRAMQSLDLVLYQSGLLRGGCEDVRASVLEELSWYYGVSEEEARQRCIHQEELSLLEWDQAMRQSGTPASFYESTEAWAFDLLWYAYLQAEGFHFPNAVVIAGAMPDRLRDAGGDLLDFGSGVGDAAQLFTRLGFRVTCADISPSLLEFARWRLEQRGEPIQYLDLRRRRLPEAAHDVILAIDCLALVPDFAATAGELHQALRTGGLLFCNFDCNEPIMPWAEQTDDVQLYWQLQRTGFEPFVNLDRRLIGFRKVKPWGVRHAVRGVRDRVLLDPTLRGLYRRLPLRAHTVRARAWGKRA